MAMTAMAHWFTDYSRNGFPVEKAALAGCDLSVAFIGGEWQWLVSHCGRDMSEGTARASFAAKQQAEAVAQRLKAAA